MTDLERAGQRGFTLVEAIIAMVITGIVAGIVSVFMVAPIRGYLDSVRRADISDVADTALRRMGYDVRAAVPNTVRVDGTQHFLEFVPASDGGRYRTQLPSVAAGEDILDGTSDTDTSFDVLGPVVAGAMNDHVVIFNTGQVGLDIYVGENRRTLSAAAGAKVNFSPVSGSPFPPYESPYQRFQLVASSGPVTFACTGEGTSAAGDGTGELRRHTGYGFNSSQLTTAAALGTGVLLADKLSACRFDYATVSAANGLVVLQLTVKRENESVTLHHEIHVDNTP